MTPHDYATRYVAAGVSVFPIARDGQKHPEGKLLPVVWDPVKQRNRASWNPFRDRLPTQDEVSLWWDRQEPPGIAVVCGDLAGGLECFDFDSQAEEILATWSADVEEECPGLLPRLSVVQTPRQPSGYHVWVRCGDQPCPGNRNLAMCPGPPREVLIQTRGEGGYALAPGSPGVCHPTGREYVLLAGPPLWKLGSVSLDEYEVLVRCARALDREVHAEPAPRIGPTLSASDLLPGQDFDQRGPDWADILEPHGWVLAGGRSEERRWRRPGKNHGWSATTGYCTSGGVDLLRVFSSSAHPFEDGKAYGRFRALCLLEFAGDYSECARTLARMGYGARQPKKSSRDSPAEMVLRGLAEADPRELRALLERVLKG